MTDIEPTYADLIAVTEPLPGVSKYCGGCTTVKALGDFHRSVRTRDGRATQCKECVRKRGLAWRAANPERKRESDRAWYKDNADHRRETGRAYREANRDRKRETDRAYREANRDRKRETDRAWVKANPARVRENKRTWCEANPERKRESIQRRRGAKRNAYDLNLPPEALSIFLETNGWSMQECSVCAYRLGDDDRIVVLDHIVPLSPNYGGGANDLFNLLPLCHGTGSCNNQKHTRAALPWIDERIAAAETEADLTRLLGVRAAFEIAHMMHEQVTVPWKEERAV